MVKAKAARPTLAEVEAFMLLKKAIVREMEWIDSPSKKAGGWMKFESRCYLGSEQAEEVDFRAQYRRQGVQVRGQAEIEIPEAFYVSIWLRNSRIYGIDTKPEQEHTNAVVPGRAYSGMTITSLTHEHIWTIAADDYVEPVDPPITDLKFAIEIFCKHVNLSLNGPFLHPMKGKTGQLI